MPLNLPCLTYYLDRAFQLCRDMENFEALFLLRLSLNEEVR